MRRALFAALLGCAVVAPSQAAILFDANGFESPTYSTGNLVGQQGWDRVDSESPTVPITVQSGTAAGGTGQAVQITSNAPGVNTYTYAIQPISLANIATSGTPRVTVSWDMRVNSSNSPSAVWGVQVYDDTSIGSGGPFSYAFAGVGPIGDPTNELLKVSAPDGDTTVAMPPAPTFNTFHSYVLDMNFQQGLYSLSVDGDLRTIGGLNLTTTNGNLGEVDFFTFGRGSDTAFFDNLVVTSGTGLVPEPASLGLIGVAGAFLLGRRRRTA
jgi:hypothetical protein